MKSNSNHIKIDFEHLIRTRSFPCLSFYIGNDQSWPANRRAMLALKGQVKKAKLQLEKLGLQSQKIDELLEPLKDWVEDRELWKSMASSLVAFLSPGFVKIYRLNLEFEDSVHIGHHFDIRALVPVMNFENFYLLIVSQECVNFFCVYPFSYEQVDIPDLPKNIKELTQHDDVEKNLQQHSFRTTSGRDSAQFHGHGRNKDYRKIQLDQYASAIASAVGQYVSGGNVPMIVVGLAPLSSMFMEHNIYSNVIDVVERDPLSQSESLLISELRRSEYSQWCLKRQEDLAEQMLRNHKSMPMAESRVDEILKKAQEGRISSLFIKKQDYVWGIFTPEQQIVEVIETHTPDSEDLLNIASVYTLQAGGRVHLFDPLKFASPEHAVAILK